MTLGEEPYISIGSVKGTSSTGFTIYDVTYYDFEEEDWIECDDENIILNDATLITKNGNFARNSEIAKDQECIVIRANKTDTARVILLTE